MADIDDKFNRIKDACENDFDSWDFAASVARIIDEIDQSQASAIAPARLRPMIRRELNQARTQLNAVARMARPDLAPPTVTPPPPITVTIIDPRDDDAHYDEGDAIELRANATGESGNYSFNISVTDSTDNEVHSDNVQNAANIDVRLPATLGPDTYNILVIATDTADNTKHGRGERRVIVDPRVAPLTLTITDIADGENWVFGTRRSFNADVTGGSGNYNYDVVLHDSAGNDMFNPATITNRTGSMGDVALPLDLVPGDYELIVKVTDVSDATMQRTATIHFTIDNMIIQITGLIDGVHIPQGTDYSFDATVTGGFGKYDYGINIYKAGMVVGGPFNLNSRGNTMGAQTASARTVGTYNIEVVARDTRVPAVMATETVTVHVDPIGAGFDLFITRPTPDEHFAEGATDPIEAFSTGGTGPYEFDVDIVDMAENSTGFSHHQPMSPATSVSVPMAGILLPGRYKARVEVSDSSTPPNNVVKEREFVIDGVRTGPASWNPANTTFFRKSRNADNSWQVFIHGAEFWVDDGSTDILSRDKSTKVGEQRGDLLDIDFNGHKWIFHLTSGQLFMNDMNHNVSFNGYDYRGAWGRASPVVNISQESLQGIVSDRLAYTPMTDKKFKLPRGWKWVFRNDMPAIYNISRNVVFISPMPIWNIPAGAIRLLYKNPRIIIGIKHPDRSILIRSDNDKDKLMVDRDGQFFVGLGTDWYKLDADNKARDSDGNEVAEIRRSMKPDYPFDIIVLLTKRKKGQKKKAGKVPNYESYEILDTLLLVDPDTKNIYLNDERKIGKKVATILKFKINGKQFLYNVNLKRLFWKNKDNEVLLEQGFDMKYYGLPIYPIVDYRKYTVGALSADFFMHSVPNKTGVFNLPDGYAWDYVGKELAIKPRGKLYPRSAWGKLGPTLLAPIGVGLNVYYRSSENKIGTRTYDPRTKHIDFHSSGYDFVINPHGNLLIELNGKWHKIRKDMKILEVAPSKEVIGEVIPLPANARYPYDVSLTKSLDEVGPVQEKEVDMFGKTIIFNYAEKKVYLGKKRIGRFVDEHTAKFNIKGFNYFYRLDEDRLFWRNTKDEVLLDVKYNFGGEFKEVHPVVDTKIRKLVRGAISTGFFTHTIQNQVGIFKLPKGLIWSYKNDELIIVPAGGNRVPVPVLRAPLEGGLAVFYANNKVGDRTIDPRTVSIRIFSAGYWFMMQSNGNLMVEVDNQWHRVTNNLKILDIPPRDKFVIGTVKQLRKTAKYPYEVELSKEPMEISDEDIISEEIIEEKKANPDVISANKNIEALNKVLKDERDKLIVLEKALSQFKSMLYSNDKYNFTRELELIDHLLVSDVIGNEAQRGYAKAFRELKAISDNIMKKLTAYKHLCPTNNTKLRQAMGNFLLALMNVKKVFPDKDRGRDDIWKNQHPTAVLKALPDNFDNYEAKITEGYGKLYSIVADVEQVISDAKRRGVLTKEAREDMEYDMDAIFGTHLSQLKQVPVNLIEEIKDIEQDVASLKDFVNEALLVLGEIERKIVS